jgi:hypothetical protein
LKPGTVFKWSRFPFPKYGGEVKARWFIYLGDTGPEILSTPVFAYLCTTTTSLEAFERGGKRASHRSLLFRKSTFTFFDEDCILDYDESPYDNIEKHLLETSPDIETKANLDRETLKRIYKGILASQYYSPKILHDIWSSLNQIGITGLVKP